MTMRRMLAVWLIVIGAAVGSGSAWAAEESPFTIRSVKNGAWSAAETWQPTRTPRAGDKVLISPGTTVLYDAANDDVLPIVQVSGTLTFARDRNTRLAVCVLKVQRAAAQASASGVEDIKDDDHEHDHDDEPTHDETMPALEVGTADRPIPSNVTAEIVLTYVEGFDREEAPAIVCRPGCRMDFHGAPMSRTWLDLAGDAKKGDTRITLSDDVTGWKVGDEILVTGGERQYRDDRKRVQPKSDRLTIKAIEGRVIELSRALEYDHEGRPGDRLRCEAANLSRSVVVRSADHADVTGHTMYHKHSAGSISYSRFERLGKKDTLGRYPIHFHRVRDTMRGSSVVGAAIVDSLNRWTTVHGTDYMIVRDCVGYRSIGHGYFLEDGTEVYNLFDRNLGVFADNGRRMKDQAIPYDPNDGAAFWWANPRNAFTRNTACENHQYGYRFDCQKRSNFDSNLKVRQPDGSYQTVDIRTLDTYRFEDNESHTEGLYAFVFAGTEGVGPDTHHPHIVKGLRAWNVHYAVRTEVPTMWVEDVLIHDAAYGIYRPWFDHHVYRNLRIMDTGAEPFNRGQDDLSLQNGPITVEGITFDASAYGGQMPFIQISDDNADGDAVTHVRHVTVLDRRHADRWPLVNLGGGPRPDPTTPTGVPVYVHDWYGPGRHAKVVSIKAKDLLGDGSQYRKDPPLTGDESVVTEVTGIEFPKLLDPVDDHPPATAITHPARGVQAALVNGALIVRGTTIDNARTAKVIVNGVEAQSIDGDYLQWQVTLADVKPGPMKLTAHGVDAAGNIERTPHVLDITIAR